MKFPNIVYDVLKYLLAIFVPALIVLVGRLGSIYGFNTGTAIETIAAIATFIGTLFGISCINYKSDKEKKTEQAEANKVEFLEEE